MGTIGVALIFCLTSSALAHVGERIVPIYELPTGDLPDLTDGSLENWEAVVPGASLDHHDFVRDLGAGGIDPMIWPGASFWRGTIPLNDCTWLSSGSTTTSWRCSIDDALAEQTVFAVDGDHSGGSFTGFSSLSEQERRLRDNAEAQQYAIGARPGAPGLLRAHWPWMTELPWGTAGGYFDEGEPNLALFEFAITPWDELSPEGADASRRTDLQPGRIVGINFFLLDIDEPGGLLQGQYATALPFEFRTADRSTPS